MSRIGNQWILSGKISRKNPTLIFFQLIQVFYLLSAKSRYFQPSSLTTSNLRLCTDNPYARNREYTVL
jgi:hypothetical protein